MSKKSLLKESQIRQFMKLAQLEPLAPGFVEGLTEGEQTDELEEVRTGSDPTPNLQRARRGHGRGRGGADGLEESEHEESELHATEDELGDMDAEADREGDEIDDLEDDLADDDAGDGRMISVDDFLGALESALESAMGEEVEIDADEVDLDDDEVEAEVDLGDEDVEVEDELALQEDKAYTAKKEKPGADKRKGAEKRGAEGTLAKTKGHGRVDYVNEEEELDEDKDYTAKKEKPGADKRKGAEKRGAEGTLAKTKGHGRVDYVDEGVFGGADKAREKRALGKKGSYAPDPDEGEGEWKGSAPGGEKRQRRPRRASDVSGMGGGMKIAGITAESQDELVEQITKRVAARILKSALSKK